MWNKKDKQQKREDGFTLIEVIATLALFTIVSFIVAGSVLSIVAANRKARIDHQVVNGISFVLEDFSRTARLGTNYQCGPATTANLFSRTGYSNCSNGKAMGFVADDGRIIVYLAEKDHPNDEYYTLSRAEVDDDNNLLEKKVSLIGPDIHLQEVLFRVADAHLGGQQAVATMVLIGVADAGSSGQTQFSFQTSAVPRLIQ